MLKRWNRPASLFSKKHSQKAPPPPKRRFSLFGFIFGAIRRTFTLVGGAIVLFALFGYVGTAMVEKEDHRLPAQIILTLTLDEGLIEMPAGGGLLTGFEAFGPTRLTTQQMIDALDLARKDPRVKALVFNIQSGDFGVSQVQELREAVKRFRESGKPSYAFSPSYAEAGGSMGAYYLASAFGEVWMQPVGLLSLPGFDGEMPFVLEGLNKLGVSPQFFQRKEYKSVMETFTREGISPENREMMASLLTDILDIIMTDIAADRGITKGQVKMAVDQGVFTDEEALRSKLVDRLDYADALISSLRQAYTGDADNESMKTVTLSRYFKNPQARPIKIKTKGERDKGKPLVGLIYAAGNIVPDDRNGGLRSNVAAANKISAAIMRASRDDEIRAIMLRIDSPGGSPTASETIRRAVEQAVSKGKPVIVSMGGVAGSGGYWIATDATRIFALPATLTGSIGVVSGKFAAPGLMDKIGVNWEGVQVGENADMWSFTKPFSAVGRERMNIMIDNMYGSFIDRVAQGRKLSPETVETIARGRVWTGSQALEIGLVDQLGGFNEALDYAAQKIGAENREGIEIVELPRPKTPFDRIFEMLNIEVAMNRVAGVAFGMIQQKMDQAATPAVRAYDPLLEQRL